jgi:hypothetical protein
VDLPVVDLQVVGTPYSGSTLLGNALNAHPAIAHVGEFSALPAFGFEPIDDQCHLCLALGRDCPVWTPETIERVSAAGPRGAFDVLREVTGAPVLLDSSKWVPWLYRTEPEGRRASRRVLALLTVRNPFAFADSVVRRDGVEPWQAANLWRDTVFDALRALGRMSLPLMVVRYEDVARDPAATLGAICRYVDLDFDDRMLRFWETSVHAISGNAGAFVWYPGYVHRGRRDDKGTWSESDATLSDAYRERSFGGWVDDKWRASLGDDGRRQVLGTPMLADLATQLGYDLLELLAGA